MRLMSVFASLCFIVGQASMPQTQYADEHPAISPDGGKIVFMSDRDGDIEIYLMQVDGTHPQRLTRSAGRDAHPTWSPDGKLIYFQSPRDTPLPQVFVMRADGSDPRRLTGNTKFTGVPLLS